MNNGSKFVFRALDFSSSSKHAQIDDRLKELQKDLRRKRTKSRIFLGGQRLFSKDKEKSEKIEEKIVAVPEERSVEIKKKSGALRSPHVLLLKGKEAKQDKSHRHLVLQLPSREKPKRTSRVDLRIKDNRSMVFDFFITIPIVFIYILRLCLLILRISGVIALKIIYLILYLSFYFIEILSEFFRFSFRMIFAIYSLPKKSGQLKYEFFDFWERLHLTLEKLGTDLFYVFAGYAWNLKTRTLPSLQLTRGWYKKELIFLLVAFGLVMPLINIRGWSRNLKDTKGAVLGEFQKAFNSGNVSDIRDSFYEAKQSIDQLGIFTKALIDITKEGSQMENLIEAGSELTESARVLENLNLNLDSDGLSLLDKIEISLKALEEVRPRFKIANKKFEEIEDDSVPQEMRGIVVNIKGYIPGALKSLDRINILLTDLEKILGKNDSKRYLLVFQNSNELRPTGGFMGSLALIDIKDGKIKSLEVPGGGAYDFQGQLKSLVIPPEPLWLVSPRWELQDANWWPSFPDSAKKILYFWEKSSGPTVDGVIAINSGFMERLLKIMDPVAVPSTQETITPEDFISMLQENIDKEKHKKEPKKIIGELAPVILDKLINTKGGTTPMLVQALMSGLNERDIMFYFSDPDIQEHFSEAGFAGELKKTQGDYLMVVLANIQGGKTDAVIKQKMNLEVNVDGNGEITNTLIIKRSHQGNKENAFEKLNNVVYARFYVPKGSKLLSAEGFNKPPLKYFEEPDLSYLSKDPDLERIESNAVIEGNTGTRISEEFGYTVFGNWMQVEPGGEAVAKISYTLPMTLSPHGFLKKVFSYQLYLQKQSGMRPQDVDVKLYLPKDWEMLWYGASDNMNITGDLGGNFLKAETQLGEDAYLGTAIQK